MNSIFNKPIFFFLPFLLLFKAILVDQKCFAYQNDFALKTGLSLGANFYEDEHNGRQSESKNSTFSYGLDAHFGYRFHSGLELSLSALIHSGTFNNQKFYYSSSTVKGKGRFYAVSFGPTIKWAPFYHYAKSWEWIPYLSLTPTRGLNTYRLEKIYEEEQSNNSDARLSNREKLQYVMNGIRFAIGIEQWFFLKDQNPSFFEFSFHSLSSEKVTLTYGSATRVRKKAEYTSREFEEKTFAFTAGFLLF